MGRRHWKAIGVVLSVLVHAGCAELTIKQYTFQGDPSRSIEDRLAMGRGVANAIRAKTKSAGIEIWGDAKFKARLEDPPLYGPDETEAQERELGRKRVELFSSIRRAKRPEEAPLGNQTLITSGKNEDNCGRAKRKDQGRFAGLSPQPPLRHVVIMLELWSPSLSSNSIRLFRSW